MKKFLLFLVALVATSMAARADVTIYVNPSKPASQYIYAWTTESKIFGEWRGKTFSDLSSYTSINAKGELVTQDGKSWYKVTFLNTDAINIIFNDEEGQTKYINVSKTSYFEYTKGATYSDVTSQYVTVDNPVTIYVKADKQPKIHAWVEGGQVLTNPYPGVTMNEVTPNALGEKWFSKSFNESKVNIIISYNGDSDKTNTISGVEGTKYYYYKGNKQYEGPLTITATNVLSSEALKNNVTLSNNTYSINNVYLSSDFTSTVYKVEGPKQNVVDETTTPITEAGNYDIVYTFDGETLTVEAKKHTTKYYIAGVTDIVNGSAWAVSEVNQMSTEDGKTYTLTVENKHLDANKGYQYKAVSSDNVWFPEGNNNKVLTENTTGYYNIVYTLTLDEDGNMASLDARTIKPSIAEYTLEGDVIEGDGKMATTDGVTYSYVVYSATLEAGKKYHFNLKDTNINSSFSVDKDGIYRINYYYSKANDLTADPVWTGDIVTANYYMKHNWAAGQATWVKLNHAPNDADGKTRYYVRAQYGGSKTEMEVIAGEQPSNAPRKAPSINDESGVNSISVEGAPIMGDICYFYYYPESKDVKIVKDGKSGDQNWTIAGDTKVTNNINQSWLLTYEGNEMSLDEATGNYVLTVYGKDLTAGKYEYAAFKDHTDKKDYRIPNPNSQAWVNVEKDGKYDITYTANLTDWTVTATLTPVSSDTEYYIRHPWSKKANDGDWTFKPVMKAPALAIGQTQNYYRIDVYGGKGFNWKNDTNTDDWDKDQSHWSEPKYQYIANPTLVNNPQPGDLCIFYVNPTDGLGMIVRIEDDTVVTGVDDLNMVNETAKSVARKVIENGQVVIIKNGVRYNMMGVRLN